MNPFRLVALAWLLILLVGCATPPHSAPTAPAAPVLLVSIDGLHPDRITPALAPHLSGLARDGVRAAWMNPSYPTLTFPNHYTVVTGLRPDRHGIVHNSMQDPALGQFSLSNRDAVGDGRWWGGEPIWVTAHKAGIASATMFWPGSEAPIAGMRPARWLPFDYKVSIPQRVQQVLGWLREPADTRPGLATLYFEHIDKAAHEHGPDSPQARAALREVDAGMGELIAGLRAARVAVNLVVVSDHGMAPVPREQVIAVEDMVDPAIAQAVTTGQAVGFAPLPGQAQAAERALLGAHAQWTCWRKQALPAHWHYGKHPRVPAIVCQMAEGWNASRRAGIQRRLAEEPPVGGSHGYDPALPSMRAAFIAAGPAFRTGAQLPAFDNVHVYPLLAHLLGIAPAASDGELAPLRPALRRKP